MDTATPGPELLTRLPRELALAICERLTPMDKAMLSVTSRRAMELYEPALYRTMSVHTLWGLLIGLTALTDEMPRCHRRRAMVKRLHIPVDELRWDTALTDLGFNNDLVTRHLCSLHTYVLDLIRLCEDVRQVVVCGEWPKDTMRGLARALVDMARPRPQMAVFFQPFADVFWNRRICGGFYHRNGKLRFLAFPPEHASQPGLIVDQPNAQYDWLSLDGDPHQPLERVEQAAPNCSLISLQNTEIDDRLSSAITQKFARTLRHLDVQAVSGADVKSLVCGLPHLESINGIEVTDFQPLPYLPRLYDISITVVNVTQVAAAIRRSPSFAQGVEVLHLGDPRDALRWRFPLPGRVPALRVAIRQHQLPEMGSAIPLELASELQEWKLELRALETMYTIPDQLHGAWMPQTLVFLEMETLLPDWFPTLPLLETLILHRQHALIEGQELIPIMYWFPALRNLIIEASDLAAQYVDEFPESMMPLDSIANLICHTAGLVYTATTTAAVRQWYVAGHAHREPFIAGFDVGEMLCHRIRRAGLYSEYVL
ncbi:hypothetical protein RI367_006782 [Sorochytrium milnesiophthora]